MTVKELIEELKKYNPEYKVECFSGGVGECYSKEVEEIEEEEHHKRICLY